MLGLRTGLAILTYVPKERRWGVGSRLPAALASLQHSGSDGPLFVVDDGSTDPAHLDYLSTLSDPFAWCGVRSMEGFRREKHVSPRLGGNCGGIGFIAEDDIAFFLRLA